MAGAERIRLLISDVDGTLVTSDKQLTPATITAVAKLHEAGMQFAVVSSRPPRGMAMLVEPLRIDTYLAGFNGGAIVRPDQTPVEERTVPRAAAEASLCVLEQAGVDIWVFANGEWLVTNPDGAYVARERRAVQFGPVVVPNFAPYVDHAGKVVGSSRDFEMLARVESKLQAELGGTASARRSQRYYLDITHPDANKGTATRDLAALIGVPIEQTACIGDMENDVPMLKIAGLSIAMGNAPPAVQAIADEVTTSNDSDGFAAAVERVILPRAAR
jgi:hypothetical protein